MKTYLKKYGIKLLVLVLLVAAVTGIGHHLRQGTAGAAADAAGAVRTPFQKVATALVGRMEDLYGVLFRYDTLKEENEQLRAQIADLQKQQMEEAQATEENQRLRELLNLSEKHSDFKYESAKVVSWNASNWNSSFTISKGSDSGLEVGDCVITEYGVLVGTVSETGSNWANVQTVTDLGTSIGVLVGSSEVSAILQGDYTLMRSQNMKLNYVASTGQIITGDTVVTSGAGGSYPQGLIVGTVSSVHSEASGQSESAVVAPFTKLEDLTQIFIIKSFEVSE
ncbi:MAG: rod shape-determining protein MreC [Oscillospiraceae bacterium]|nr:rod shape-determining protein MreC [Oscillospiraceae bacterium]